MSTNRIGVPRRLLAGCCATVMAAGLGLVATSALALEPAKDELDKLKACEKQLCAIVKSKSDKGANYACTLAKTWGQTAIEKGAKRSSVSWSFGDARCNLDVTLSRADIVSALTQPTFTLAAKEHTVKCEIHRSGSVEPVTAIIAPKIEFKDGRAEKAWFGVKSIEGPTEVRALVNTLVKLHDKAGLFHGGTIKAINKMLQKTCFEGEVAKK